MKETMDITEKSTVCWEGSWGNSEPETVNMRITASANRETGRGCFEIYDLETGGNSYYAEGGLWFNDKGYLTDYDGTYSLDSRIIEWLDELNMIDPDSSCYFRERVDKIKGRK